MSTVGQPERTTQNRVVARFRDELGYQSLGDWTGEAGNRNVVAQRITGMPCLA